MQEIEMKERTICAKCGQEKTCYLKTGFYFCFRCLQKTIKVKTSKKKEIERKIKIVKPIV